MRIKLRQLVHAQAVFRYGNFRQAAEAVHISQPALSRSIQNLEVMLGVPLFDRHTTEVTPTAFGQAVLRRAEILLLDAEELEREIMLLQGLGIGCLSVGMGLYPAELSGNQALAALIGVHPNLQISVRIRYSLELQKLVTKREVDLGFGEISHLMDTPGLKVESIGQHELLCFCRPGHPILARKSISEKDLDAFPVVSTPVRAERANLFPRNLRLDPTGTYSIPALQVEDLTAMRVIVSATDAISYATPVQLEPHLRRGEFAAIPFRAPWLRLDYGFFYLAARSLSPAVEAFMTLVRQIESELAEKNRVLLETILQGLKVVPAGGGLRVVGATHGTEPPVRQGGGKSSET